MAQHPPSGLGSPHYRCFTITLIRTIFSRTPLDEWSARRRDLYLKTHNTHKIQTAVKTARFEPANPASERPLTHALDGAVTGIWIYISYSLTRFICMGFCMSFEKEADTSRPTKLVKLARCNIKIPTLHNHHECDSLSHKDKHQEGAKNLMQSIPLSSLKFWNL